MKSSRQPIWALIAILAILLGASWLRATHLTTWPPGLSRDQAVNGVDALNIAQIGTFPFYSGDGRPEPLYRLFLAPLIALIGPNLLALRFVSFAFGVLAVAAAYRAGRHMVPRQSGRAAPILAGLLAAGTLAILPGHITLSRVAYRAIPLPFGLLMFVDAFVTAWRTRRRDSFLAAGIWLGFSVMSYTAGLAALPIAALGGLHQGLMALIRRPKRPPRISWISGNLWMGVALLAIISGLLVMGIIQPELFSRANEVSRVQTFSDVLARAWTRSLATWQTFTGSGDINPQYNIASEPLIPLAPLYWLLLIGGGASLPRWRRVAGWLAVGLLAVMLLPEALANEVPHGLRIVGEFAAIPLVIAASVDPFVWLLRKLSAFLPSPTGRRAGDEGAAPAAYLLSTFLALATIAILLLAGGIRTAHIMESYYTSDVRWGKDGVVSAFSWFFETRRQTLAADALSYDGVIYLPLADASHPSTRYFLASRWPRVKTYAEVFGTASPLTLPGGRVYVTGSGDHATYVALMPDGTIVLLPRFDDDTLTMLDSARESGRQLTDPYGEFAGSVVDLSDTFTIDHPIAHPAHINYGDQFTLIGWDGPDVLPADESELRYTLYFTPGPRLHRSASLYVQLWDHGLNRLAGSEEDLILRWVYPPDRWQPGDVIPVEVRQPIPAGLAPGAYYLAVGLHNFRADPILVLGADGAPVADAAIAGTLKEPRAEAVSTQGMIPASADFDGQITLIGYRITDETGAKIDALMPGQSATVTLYWQAIRRPDAEYTAFLHVVDPSGDLAAQSDVQPAGGAYPTAIWDAGEIITTIHPITVPADSSGPFTLYTGWYSFPDLVRLPVTQFGEPVPDGRALIAVLTFR